MNTLDIILIVIILGSVIFGLRMGIVHMFGAVVGTIAGAIIGGLFYETLSSYIEFIFLGNVNLARVFCFAIIFILIDRLIGFIFSLIAKNSNLITKLPFIKTINRLGGGILGLIEINLWLGIILFLLTKYSIHPAFDQLLVTSKFVGPLITFASFLIPLLPKELINLSFSLPDFSKFINLSAIKGFDFSSFISSFFNSIGQIKIKK
ncbi:CvpA family protein [Candidatus Kuenenbacteria bacterium]|nr:CvpA family protein [Candidatus Kuenenbacteria bacterium]